MLNSSEYIDEALEILVSANADDENNYDRVVYLSFITPSHVRSSAVLPSLLV